MCLFVTNYSAYQQRKNKQLLKNKNTNIGLSLHLKNRLEQFWKKYVQEIL